MKTLEEAKFAFSHITDLSAAQTSQLSIFNKCFQDLLASIYMEIPESADRTYAARKLWEAKAAVVQAVTHGVTSEDKVARAG